MLQQVSERQQLVGVALNTHGTRAVQKLIETLSSREQKQIVIEALKDGACDQWMGLVVPKASLKFCFIACFAALLVYILFFKAMYI